MRLLDPPLPVAWLPDEIVYSLAARYHRISGNRSSAATARALFGRSNRGGHADIPTSLSEMANRANRMLGSAPEMIEDRTVLGCYLRFASAARVQALTEAIATAQLPPHRIRAALNIGTAKDVALRACSICMCEDQRRFGVAYWHRSHQLPCTWICLKHRQALHLSDVTGEPSWLHRWVLPDASALHELAVKASNPLILRCARIASAVTAMPASFHFDLTKLNHVYLSQGNRVADGAEDTVAELPVPVGQRCALVKVLSGLPCETIAGFRCQLHIGAVALLFRSWREFWEKYSAIEFSPRARTRVAQPELKKRFVALVRNGRSITGAARQVGVDVTTGQTWAASINITAKSKPKKLNSARRQQAIELLQRGAEKAVVAYDAGVSQVSVTKLLGVVPGLRARWTDGRVEGAIDSAKCKFLRLTDAAPDLGAKALRALEPAAYALLYRRDREWLLSLLASKSQSNNAASVDQRLSDTHVGALIERALSSVHMSVIGEPDAADILLAVPALASVARNLPNMPQTQRALANLRKSLISRQLPLFGAS